MKAVVLAVAAACLLATGCATNAGTQSVNDFGRYQQITNGQTTKPQLFQVFGQPHEVRYIDTTGESIWSYFHVTSRMNPTTFIPFVGLATGGSDLDITRADFYFGDSDVLLRYQREERSRYVNQWIGLGDALTPSGQVDSVRQEMGRLNLPFDLEEAQTAAGWADLDD